MITFIVCIIVGLCFCVQSTFGFGAGLISLPFLTMLIGAKTSIGMNLIFQTASSVLLLGIWKDVSFKKLPVLLFSACVGIILGVLFLKNIDDHTLEVILGFYLVFYSGRQLLKDRIANPKPPSRFKTSPFYAIACGFPGGLISGAFGTGGPMLVSYVKSLNMPKDNLRATNLLVMFFCNITRIIMTWQTNQFDEKSVTYALYAAPLFVLGLWGGAHISKKLSDKQFLHAINIIILLAGSLILIKHFMGV